MMKLKNHIIILLEHLDQDNYILTKKLRDICISHDSINLKLELNYKKDINKNSSINLKNVNEFLYFIDDKLIAYLGISSFSDETTGELNGMVHPDYRRHGYYKKLFNLAIDECRKRKFKIILLLSDQNSTPGISFIESIGGKYDFSEYRMTLSEKVNYTYNNIVSLRLATNDDAHEIWRQYLIYSKYQGEYLEPQEIKTGSNEFNYMVELDGNIIGKIKLDFEDTSAFISGVGILPEFRGKGYGRETLKEALLLINNKNIYKIELDVECKNNKALDLYKSCGFNEQSSMAYYEYKI